MPRTSRRRTSRKRLSTSRVLTRTSARAQARQIIALRNRINRISRLNRKELRNFQQTYSKTFTSSAFSSVYDTWGMSTSFMSGQWTKLRGFSINGILEYADNREAFPQNNITRSGSIRLVIYQIIQSRVSTVNIDSLLEIGATGTDYELNTTRPLKNGVTSFVKILYDRTYTLSNQVPQRRVRIYLRKLLNLHKETDDTVPKGTIKVGIVTSGLHWTSDGYIESITASLISKEIYTED